MDKFINLFKKLWVSEHASILYLDLLEHGTSSIADIVKRTTLHRPEVYGAIPFLEESRLISLVSKGKRTYYQAGSPERIEDMIRDFEKKNSSLVSLLREKYEKLWKNISISYQEGPKSITRVFDDIVDVLPKNAIFHRISAENDVDKANSYLPKTYREKRDKKNLERYVIMGSQAAKSKTPRLERELVIIPESLDEFDQNVSLTVYGDKLAYIDFTNESSIIIENPMIAEFQRKLFMLTYKGLKR